MLEYVLLNFLIGPMLMTIVWSVVSLSCAWFFRLQSPVARFFIFIVPLVAAFGARVRLSGDMAIGVIFFCVLIAILLFVKDLYHYYKFCLQVQAEGLPSSELQTVVNDLAKSFGIAPPRALVSISNDSIISPLAAGLRAPFIILPHQILPHLTDEETRLLLAHEIAHIRRKDLFWKWFLLFLRRLSFLNPVADLPFRWLNLEMERGSDRLALSVTGKPGTFARMLLQVEEFLTPNWHHAGQPGFPNVVSSVSSYIPARIKELACPLAIQNRWVTLIKVGAICVVYKLLCFKPVEVWTNWWT